MSGSGLKDHDPAPLQRILEQCQRAIDGNAGIRVTAGVLKLDGDALRYATHLESSRSAQRVLPIEGGFNEGVVWKGHGSSMRRHPDLASPP